MPPPPPPHTHTPARRAEQSAQSCSDFLRSYNPPFLRRHVRRLYQFQCFKVVSPRSGRRPGVALPTLKPMQLDLVHAVQDRFRAVPSAPFVCLRRGNPLIGKHIFLVQFDAVIVTNHDRPNIAVDSSKGLQERVRNRVVVCQQVSDAMY